MSTPTSAAPDPATGAPASESPVVPVVVLDLDGVLADTRHRSHHLRRRPKDWNAFFAAAAHDPVHRQGLALAHRAVADGAVVVYLSGRPERTRAATEAWLRRVGAPTGPVLLRADGDRRPARVVKVAALRALARTAAAAVLVDDDPDVVAAVRAEPGLVGAVVHADWQPREPEVHAAQERAGRT
ncbi:HAD family acid phosphatase [Quadrisphaera sp. DSM 44207]|uniref:phosphatase domain-containing protein n=1 Tax=Quadrisphaera sp. DSM 44207 TaxID=1881057 RepID=UPI001C40B197|nr:HAD family acid phosphatase [Quadrisphaera sp. DSM 44207]